MNFKLINALFFLLPFVGAVFNVQDFASLYFSRTLAQIVAYSLLLLLFIGIIINIKQPGKYSRTAKLWIVFYMFYFAFGILASTFYDNPTNILVSLVPVIYMFAFFIYLRDPKNIELFETTTLLSFIISTVLGIYLFKISCF